ncbi:restriction endonuclease subunit S [Schleiferiaceae bacterium]|nr:restriction endonuclease subunit S [Schleiferiaceae bacterium]
MIPKLRFQEFTGNYNHNTFKDYVVINQGLQIAISERLNSPLEGAYFYITNEFLRSNSLKSYWVKNPPKSSICSYEDILMTRTGNTGIVVTDVQGVFHNNFFKIKYPSNYFNKVWLVEYLRRNAIQKQILRYAGTSTIPDLNHKDFYRLPLLHPSIKEQTKIANLLSILNSKINLLTKKKEVLETYKKGLMQKIFSQELRFKREDGTNYPEWGKVRIGDVFEVTRGKVLATSLTKQQPNESFTYPVYSSQTKANGLMGFYDEFLFSDAITWTTDGANAGEVRFRRGKFYSTNVCGVLLSEKYANTAVSIAINRVTHKYVSYVGNPKLMNGVMSEIALPLPTSSAEMKHISSLFEKLEDKISMIQKRIETVDKLKQGLLQQMFV